MAVGKGSMRLRDTPSPVVSQTGGDFGFSSPHPKKESLPPSPLAHRSKNCGASHRMPVLSVLTHTGLSTMTAIILLACCLAAWPIHLSITRPVARMLGLID